MLPILTIAMGIASGPSPAQPVEPPDPVEARLITELTGVTPGSVAHVALDLTIDPGWHVYWNGYNDSGVAPRISWSLPEGVSPGPIQWPAPTRYLSPGGIVDHVYEGRVTLIVPLEIADDVRAGDSLRVQATASWMVCDEICLMGRDRLEATLTVMETTKPTKDAGLFKAARERHPKPLPDDVSATWVDGGLRISAPGAAAMSFFPGHDCVELDHLLEDGAGEGPLLLRITGEGVVEGVLEIVDEDGKRRAFQFREPTPS